MFKLDKSWKKNNDDRVQNISENLKLPIHVNPMYQHIKPAQSYTTYGNRAIQPFDIELRPEIMITEAYEPSNLPIMVYNTSDLTGVSNREQMYYTTMTNSDIKDQSLSYDCNNNLVDGFSLPHFSTFLEWTICF